MCSVRPRLVGASLLKFFGRVCLFIRHACTECQAFEGSLAWMLYWSNVLFLLDTLKPCYLQTLSIKKASAKSPVLQVALLVAKQAALFWKSPGSPPKTWTIIMLDLTQSWIIMGWYCRFSQSPCRGSRTWGWWSRFCWSPCCTREIRCSWEVRRV